MMKSVYYAAAKINLSLDILGKREDGYHLMEMLMQSVSLFDRVEISIDYRKSGIQLECNMPEIPLNEKNLAWKAAERFLKAAGIQTAVHIQIDKKIPSQAGMAGGSADAAAVLVGLNEMLGLPLEEKKLFAIGLSIGADVPFCMAGGTKYVKGIGEQIISVPALPECTFLIVKPVQGVETAACFHRYDLCSDIRHPDTLAILEALEKGSKQGVFSKMRNVLEQAAECPAVENLKERITQYRPLGCAMTGSGSAVAAAFESASEAEHCFNSLADLQKEGARLFLACPVPYGVCREQSLDHLQFAVH